MIDCRPQCPPAIGEQPSSLRRSASSSVFSTASRASRLKCGDIAQRKSTADLYARQSPGAIYDLPLWLGTAPTTRMAPLPTSQSRRVLRDGEVVLTEPPDSQPFKYMRTPQFIFTGRSDYIGSAKQLGGLYDPDDAACSRPASAPCWTMRPRTPIQGHRPQTPSSLGPNTYRPAVCIGKQALSTRKTAPAPRFSSAPRFRPHPNNTDGAVKINLPSTMGKQVDGRYKSGPSFGFGSSTRDGRSRTGYSAEKGPCGAQKARISHPKVAPQKEIIQWGSVR
eukprot:GEMP01026186.1.p1 GENE.GEMP01026186.1~~GEMP01026186.1.p1  ORF type:complete len:279 (+),score=39.23 GEMP01026186.1:45-881(+)